MSPALGTWASSESSFFGLIRRQLTQPQALPGVRLANEYATVTGSYAGIGLEASWHLLRLGVAHLIMGVRSQTRGDEAAAKLHEDFPASEVTVWVLDMESYDSVQDFVGRCATLPRLDIAILNAGFITTSFTLSKSKHEVTLQVNYPSIALLSILLLPVLRAQKSKKLPVLSIVGSDIIYSTPFETAGPILQPCDNAKDFSQPRLYGVAKLFMTLFVWRLAETVDGILINMVNPGMTKGTGFFSGQPLLMRKIMGIVQFIMGARTPETAATVYIDAISRGPESHGSFLSEWAIKPYPSLCCTAAGKQLRDQLWEETMEELKFADVSGIISGQRK